MGQQETGNVEDAHAELVAGHPHAGAAGRAAPMQHSGLRSNHQKVASLLLIGQNLLGQL